MSNLLPVAEALQRLLAAARPLSEAVELPLIKALGHVVFQDIVSTINVPGSDNSAMDGYALRAADVGVPLRVSQRIPAGAMGTALQPHTAARIFTGAPIPGGADAVVMQENCDEVSGMVTVRGAVSAGSNIRERGQDIRSGSVAVARGCPPPPPKR
jgi:molybdopterin molybdotransferase